VFNTDGNEVIVDNVGSYSGDTVFLVGIQIDNYVGADGFIKLSARPANQSAISPLREDVLELDQSNTFSRVIEVDTGVTN
jgi:hypothetical protein